MPVYQYADYRNPYGPSIAEALAHQNDAAAAGALRAGDIQAAAAQRTGALQGQLWSDLGAMPGQIQAQRTAAQEMALRQQAQQLNALQIQGTLADRQRQRDAETAFAQALHATPLNEDGTYDVPGIAKAVDPKYGAAAIPLFQHIESVNSVLKGQTDKDRQDAVRAAQGIIGAGTSGAGPSPVLTDNWLVTAAKRHLITGDQLRQYRQILADDPTQAEPLLRSFIGPQKGEVVPKDAAVLDPLTNKPLFSNVPPDKPDLTYEKGVQGPNGEPLVYDKHTGSWLTPTGEKVTTPVIVKDQTPKTYQKSSVLLDGKPAEVLLDPSPGGKVYDLSGVPIDNAATRITPIPAASLTIHNEQQKATAMPAWALDDARPAGADANVPDAGIRMTPNGLHQAALNYIANGQFPPTGRGSDPIAVAQRTAITSKVGAIAAASGMDEPALRAFYKANGQSLAAEQKMQDAVQGFMATADKNAALLQESLKKIPDTGSPLFNQPLRAFTSKVAGDPNLSQFATYLQSVQNEYGRIISQPNLAGQLTDSARHEAETLASPDATVPQLLASLQALQNEGSNRLQSVGEQIQRIQRRMQAGPASASPPPTVTAPAAPVKGALRTVNGQTRVWDGQQWQPVR